jgi:hypothetical protein
MAQLLFRGGIAFLNWMHLNTAESLESPSVSASGCLRCVIPHPTTLVAILGAKSPEQAAMTAAAGDRLLTAPEIDGLLARM